MIIFWEAKMNSGKSLSSENMAIISYFHGIDTIQDRVQYKKTMIFIPESCMKTMDHIFSPHLYCGNCPTENGTIV